MNLAITNSDEIMELLRLLRDLTELKKEFSYKHLRDIDFSELETLSDIKNDDIEEALEQILTKIDNIHFHRILWNCDVLLKNCADLTKDVLDYNPDIKKGLELLEAQKVEVTK